MARRREEEDELKPRRHKPAATPEARENQMISLAFDAAEKQIREGTASSQLLTHFVKLGSMREDVEKQRLEAEVKLLHKKIETMESSVRVEALMDEALKAFRGYSGNPDPEDEYDIYEP